MGPRTLVSPGERSGWWAGQTESAICNPLKFFTSYLSSYLGLEAYCMIKILWRTDLFDFQRGTCGLGVLSRLRCNLHSLLLSSISLVSRILPAAPADTLHFVLHCPATDSSATLGLSTTSGLCPGEFPGSWSSMVFCHAPIPRKGSGDQQQQ